MPQLSHIQGPRTRTHARPCCLVPCLPPVEICLPSLWNTLNATRSRYDHTELSTQQRLLVWWMTTLTIIYLTLLFQDADTSSHFQLGYDIQTVSPPRVVSVVSCPSPLLVHTE
jgi:hypothetical protein